jgi:predicted amidophosphoribosyltransferase
MNTQPQRSALGPERLAGELDVDEVLELVVRDEASPASGALRGELVVSVPPRPGQPDRFEAIRGQLAKRLRAADGSSVLRQTRVIADYRQLTRAQRAAVCPGRFVAAARLHGKRVLLIDDVVTSGSQAREAARALIGAGAAGWRFAAVAQATAAPGQDPAAQLDDGL